MKTNIITFGVAFILMGILIGVGPVLFPNYVSPPTVEELQEQLNEIKIRLDAIEERQEQPTKKEVAIDWNAIAAAIIRVESSGDTNAVSPAGARGLMQIMGPTWTEMTTKIYGAALPFDKAFDPEINRKVGTRYLQWIDDYLRNRLGDDYSFTGTIMSYYWGIGNYCKHVENNPEDPFPADVRGYYEKFQSFYARRTQ